jgi:hypothetical protein
VLAQFCLSICDAFELSRETLSINWISESMYIYQFYWFK